MGARPREVSGELSPASVYVSLLPVVEACVVVAVPGRVGEVIYAWCVTPGPGFFTGIGDYWGSVKSRI